MLQLEDDFGIVPSDDGSSFAIDPKAPNAPKLAQMMKAWAAKRRELGSGEISEKEYQDWKSHF